MCVPSRTRFSVNAVSKTHSPFSKPTGRGAKTERQKPRQANRRGNKGGTSSCCWDLFYWVLICDNGRRGGRLFSLAGADRQRFFVGKLFFAICFRSKNLRRWCLRHATIISAEEMTSTEIQLNKSTSDHSYLCEESSSS